MLKLELKIFGISLDLNIKYQKPKADKRKKAEESIETFLDVIEDVEETPIYEETHISHQMRKFEEELRNTNLYEIPTYEDIPPKYQINDDVEVITDKFEREIEDLYEGRR